jgi:hypothetical protein
MIGEVGCEEAERLPERSAWKRPARLLTEWALNLTVYHAVISITVPLILLRLFYPRRAALPALLVIWAPLIEFVLKLPQREELTLANALFFLYVTLFGRRLRLRKKQLAT